MKISKDYPKNLSNDELIEQIEKYTQKATQATYDPQYSLGPAYWREISALGQSELNIRLQKGLQREIKSLNDEIAQLKKNNRRFGVQTIFLSITTILIAGLTLFIGYKTLNFSRVDNQADDLWKKEQIKLLENEHRLIKKQNELIDSLLILNEVNFNESK